MPRRRDARLALAALVVTVAVVYAGSLGGELVLDARPLILENPAVRQVTLANVRTLLTRPYWHPFANDGLYRPATTLSYLVNYAALGNGERPFGYHVVNLAVHLANVALVFALVAGLVGRWPAALLAAAIFGVHPITTEAVTNVAGRADLLATLGVLAGLLAYTRVAGDARAGFGWTALFGAGGLLAAASKESGFLLLPVLVLYDALVARSSPRDVSRDHRRLAAYGCVALVAAIVVLARGAASRAGHLLEGLSPIDNPIVEAGFWSGRLTGMKAVGRELWLLVWPATLSSDYSYDQVPIVRLPPRGWDDWQAFLAIVAIGALVMVVFRARRARPALAFFLSFALLALLPTANLVVVIGSIMAERFLYLPLVGFAGAVALACEPLVLGGSPARRRIVATIVVVMLGALAWRTVVRNRDWRDDATLAARSVETAPGSAKAQRGYAATVFATDPARERLDDVIRHAERALAIRGDWIGPMLDLGQYHVAAAERAASRGDDPRPSYQRAVEVLERAKVIDVRDNRRFAEKMVASGRAAGGIPETGHVELYERLALAYWRLGRGADAIAPMRDVIRLRPMDSTRYVELAQVLREVGRWEDAATTYFQALTLAADDQQVLRELVDLYRRADVGDVIVADGGDRVRVNVQHPTVRRHRCAAYRDLEQILARANLPAESARAAVLYRRDCPP